MTPNNKLLLSLILTVLTFKYANAHTFSICAVTNGGTVDFYAASYHTEQLSGGLLLDGQRYNFQSLVAANALPASAVCVTCPNAGVTLRFYQKVTVAGLTNGDYSVSTTCDTSNECPLCTLNTLTLTGLGFSECQHDVEAPLIKCPSKKTVSLDSTCHARVPNLLGDVLACDKCSENLVLTQSPVAGTLIGLGTTSVLVTATDAAGNFKTCTILVNAVDKKPPVINNLSVSPNSLCPPNHKMIPVAVTGDFTDNCATTPSCFVNSVFVSSNEDDNGLGDGNTVNDWQVTGNFTLLLRAERSGPGSGRIYTVGLSCFDPTGNQATLSTQVTVPHNP